ncbi:MAG: hypothetical protein O9292_09520 [Rhodobacteraceae bacterium]|nr:hypothetical protein [Paracoccaceae bacterium]MCZ8152610.1 hypothetical protein [Paracoccaceae bacterium]MCZ8335629.1 hypothetical protein [Paracoccaceae bacterium]
MTTIITRLYTDVTAAQAVVAALTGSGHNPATIDVITREGPAAATDRMRAARVPSSSAAAYAPAIAEGRALLVVCAPFAPMGTARHAIKTVNRYPSLSVGLANEDVYIREDPKVDLTGKIYSGTTFFMSNPYRPTGHGHIFGSNPISPSKPRTSAIRGGGYMSTKFWPGKLLSAPKERNSAMRGGWLVSSLFGLPTIIREWPSRDLYTKI